MLTGTQIKTLRNQLNLSQQELAEKADVSLITISNIERGKQKNPKIQTLQRISDVFSEMGFTPAAPTPAMPDFVQNPYANVAIDRNKKTILIIDDSKAERVLLRAWLEKGYEKDALQIIDADSPETGYAAFQQLKPDCILLDFMMFGLNGFQFMLNLKQNYANLPPIIFITSFDDPQLEQRARAAGAASFCNKKDLSPEVLANILNKALKEA